MSDSIFRFTVDFENKVCNFNVYDDYSRVRRLLFSNDGKVLPFEKVGNEFFQWFHFNEEPKYILVLSDDSSKAVEFYEVDKTSFVTNKIKASMVSSKSCFETEKYIDEIRDEKCNLQKSCEIKKHILENGMSIEDAIREYISICKVR